MTLQGLYFFPQKKPQEPLFHIWERKRGMRVVNLGQLRWLATLVINRKVDGYDRN